MKPLAQRVITSPEAQKRQHLVTDAFIDAAESLEMSDSERLEVAARLLMSLLSIENKTCVDVIANHTMPVRMGMVHGHSDSSRRMEFVSQVDDETIWEIAKKTTTQNFGSVEAARSWLKFYLATNQD